MSGDLSADDRDALSQVRSSGRLRVLVISNVYPPHYIGGYELGCADVVSALGRRGHTLRVLTSSYGIGRSVTDDLAYRWLTEDAGVAMDKRQQLRQMLRKEVANLRALDRAVSLFHPDVVYVWRMAHVSISVVARAARRGYPVCFFVSDSWLADWETDLWYSRAQAVRVGWKRALLGALRTFGLVEPSMSLDLSHVQFASEYLKTAAIERGKRVHDARVIHWGVDLDAYPFRAVRRQPLRLLYVGQVIPHKGVHTAIQALKHVMEAGAGSVTLTVAGGSIIPDYARAMRVLVKELNLEGRVNFTGSLPREKVQELYLSHDILVFPSVWDEPFSITMLEAMSSGMALVSTLTGGTGEILQDGVNALAFPKEDAAACARQILRLIRETELLERIRVAARREVESAYSFESMVDQIEDSLVLARKERMSA